MTIQPLSSTCCSAAIGASRLFSPVTTQSTSSGSGQGQAQLSPAAQLLKELQQLEQQDPAQFQQVTAAMSSSLQKQAQTAQQKGNTTEAGQLNQLASALSTASSTGNLSPLQSALQQQASPSSGAASAAHRHHHHHGGGDHDESSSASGSATSGSATSSSGSSDTSNSTSGSTTTKPGVLAYQQNSTDGEASAQSLLSLFQSAVTITH